MAFKSFTLKRKKKDDGQQESNDNTLSSSSSSAAVVVALQNEIDQWKKKLHDSEQEKKNLSLSLVIEKQRHQVDVEKLEEKVRELTLTIEALEKQNKHDMLWSATGALHSHNGSRIYFSEANPQKLISRLPVEIHVTAQPTVPERQQQQHQVGSMSKIKTSVKEILAKGKIQSRSSNDAKRKSGHVFDNLCDAVRLAHDYANATKIDIIVHEGEFDTSGQITINRPNVKIRGQGTGKTVLRMKTGTIVFQEEASSTLLSNIRIVRGNERFKQPLVRVFRANTIISDCELDGGDCYIAGDERNSEFTVSRSSGYSSTTTEENMQQQLLHQPAQLLNTVIHRSPGYGVMLYHYSSAIVMGCDIHHCRDSGIMITQTSDPLIHNNKIHDNEQCGVLVRSSYGVIEDNQIFSNGSNGVEITSYANPLLRGNTIHNNGRFAIAIYEEGKGRIEANAMTENARGKIEVQEGTSPNIAVSQQQQQQQLEQLQATAAAVDEKGKKKDRKKSKSKSKSKEKKKTKRKKDEKRGKT